MASTARSDGGGDELFSTFSRQLLYRWRARRETGTRRPAESSVEVRV